MNALLYETVLLLIALGLAYFGILWWINRSGSEPWNNPKIVTALKIAAAAAATSAGGYAAFNDSPITTPSVQVHQASP